MKIIKIPGQGQSYNLTFDESFDLCSGVFDGKVSFLVFEESPSLPPVTTDVQISLPESSICVDTHFPPSTLGDCPYLITQIKVYDDQYCTSDKIRIIYFANFFVLTIDQFDLN